jgi:3-hydroxyisobutyrate dehydrogenase-like beta-hydroxyacid dehydrogenase
MQVAFCGLGRMGRPMAANLVAAGHSVRVWNRTPGKAPARAIECRTPAEAAQGAEVVVTMLADDAAVEVVVFGADGILEAPAIHCGMSTISMQLSERLSREKQRYVAAPVFGRPDAAEARKLRIVAGGDQVEQCRPIFDALGEAVFVAGSGPQASLTKLCGNFCIAGLIEMYGEVFALGEKAGMDTGKLAETLSKILFANAPIAVGYGARIAATQFEPAGFAMALGLKDVTLALKAAEALKAPLPLGSLMRDHFLESLAKGREHFDWGGMAAVLREAAGLKPQK